MLTSNFLILLADIFALGFIFAIIIYLVSNKKNRNISDFFSENKTYRKFTDQSDPCVDDIVKDFKLLDDWLIEF